MFINNSFKKNLLILAALGFFFFFFFFVWACGIYFPDQGSNPGPLHWKHGVLITGPPEKSLFKKKKMLFFLLW